MQDIALYNFQRALLEVLSAFAGLRLMDHALNADMSGNEWLLALLKWQDVHGHLQPPDLVPSHSCTELNCLYCA